VRQRDAVFGPKSSQLKDSSTRELDELTAELVRLHHNKATIDALTLTRAGIVDELGKAREFERNVRRDAAESINTKLCGRVKGR
jgi:hypothetical protein